MAVDNPPLGRLLRRHRASAVLTQEELAERAGISVRTISYVERGLRASVHRDTAERLAEALGLPEPLRLEFEAAAHGRRGPRTAAALTGPFGVPAQLTSLIGREHELGLIASALESGARLVTITGPGGVGKTRLAIEAAATSASSRYPEGRYFVALAAHRDARVVASVIAGALGVTPGRADAAAALAEHLHDRRILLVLDTFEHLTDAATLVSDLLAACHSLTVIVTSRSRLHLRGEHEIALAPVDLPSAIAIFLECARQARPSLRLDGSQIAGICRALDGLPLAIELAAARIKHLDLAGLHNQLEDRLSLLAGGPRD